MTASAVIAGFEEQEKEARSDIDLNDCFFETQGSKSCKERFFKASLEREEH